MRLTIGRKLGLGFGSLIAIIAVSSTLTYVKFQEVAELQARTVELRYPTLQSCSEMMNGINHSLAGLRGYMILGDDPDRAAFFRNDRAAAWDEIDKSFAELQAFSESWTDPANIERLSLLAVEIEEFREAQFEVEAIAQTIENVPASKILLTEAAPKAAVLAAQITLMIDLESEYKSTIVTGGEVVAGVVGIEASLQESAERKALLGMMADTRGTLGLGLGAIRAYLLTGDEKFKEQFDQLWAKNTRRFGDLSDHVDLLTAKQREAFDLFASTREQFDPLPGQMFEVRGSVGWNLANLWLGTKAAPRAGSISKLLGEMRASQTELAKTDSVLLAKAMGTMVSTLFLCATVGILLGCMIAILMGRALTGAINEIIVRIKDIAEGEGDLTKRVPETRGDELGELAKWFNVFVQKVHDIVVSVNGASFEVATAANEIAASSEESAKRMENQQLRIAQIASAMEQMSVSIVEVANKSKDAASSGEMAGQAAIKGGRIVESTIEGMGAIYDAVIASSASVAELGRRGDEIDEIIGVINDIADQTNLLALNAAIEAARAGEHGRGFAVVADEVRKLADRTTEATEEVASSIKAIQAETIEAVGRMDVGKEEVENGTIQAKEAGESLRMIVESSSDVAVMVQSIAAASEQQSAASTEVAEAVESISVAMSDAAEGAKQSATAVMQLSSKAEGLQELMRSFKLEAPDRRTEDEGDYSLHAGGDRRSRLDG